MLGGVAVEDPSSGPSQRGGFEDIEGLLYIELS